MNKLTIKIATAVSTVALVVSSIATPLLATTVEVSGNGANSDSNVTVNQSTSNTVSQTNDANITNNVNVQSNTGGNKAKDNTGGNVEISTGDSNSTVNVSNTANSNQASVSCGCPADVNVKVSGNGAKSDNDVKVNTANNVGIDQDNTANIKNNIYVKQGTGNNSANDNGGNVSIETGSTDSTVKVANTANANWAAVTAGPNGGASLDIQVNGNGAHSDNDVTVGLATVKTIDQTNYANIKNDVDVYGTTGKNKAKDNTGGEVSISTGDADSTVEVSNMANFNAANLEGCGCIGDLNVKVAGNGAKSDNDVTLALASATAVDQDNTFQCGGSGDLLGGLDLFNSGYRNHSKNCADVNVNGDTGDNSVKGSTSFNGDPSITTGDAGSDVKVNNTANQNVVGNNVDFTFPGNISWGNSSLLLQLLAFFS